MLRKRVGLGELPPNIQSRRAGPFKPLTAASILAMSMVMSPGQASAVECFNFFGAGGNNENDGNEPKNTACGDLAQAKAPAPGFATAIGADTKANFVASTAVGATSEANSQFSSAFGFRAKVDEANVNGSEGATALGAAASVGFDGTNKFNAARAIAIGTDSIADVNNVGATALAPDSIAIGTDAVVSGTAPAGIAMGLSASSNSPAAIAIGAGASSSSLAVGFGAKAQSTTGTALATPFLGFTTTGTAAAVGDFAQAIGDNTSAFGAFSQATAKNATALGSNAKATAVHATAVGANTEATFAGSAAFGADDTGAGAKATREREQVFGTARNTYTMPGITSNESFARQTVGPIELVTVDQAGHLATDRGFFRDAFDDLRNDLDEFQEELREERDELREGIAVALATEDPDLVGNERFALKFNWGGFEGENALAVTAALAFGRSIIVPGDRLTLSGGAGFGLEHDTVGGRLGLQFSWGGAPDVLPGFPPLK
jgi:autotransporter adhesin